MITIQIQGSQSKVKWPGHQKMPLGSSLVNMPSKSSSLPIRSSSTFSSAHWWSVSSSASHSAWAWERETNEVSNPFSATVWWCFHGRMYLESFICVCRHGHGGSAHLLLHNPWLICTCGWWQENSLERNVVRLWKDCNGSALRFILPCLLHFSRIVCWGTPLWNVQGTSWTQAVYF